MQDHLVVPGPEPLPALPHVQRFGQVGERHGRLDDDEVVDFRCHFAHSDLQPFQLRVDEGQGVDFAAARAVREGFEAVARAVGIQFGAGGEEGVV